MRASGRWELASAGGRGAGPGGFQWALCPERAPAEAAGHAFEYVPDFQATIGDGDAVQRHGVLSAAHLGDVRGPAYLRSLFDVAQVDGVVEQEKQSLQRVTR